MPFREETLLGLINGDRIEEKRQVRFFLDRYFPDPQTVATNYVRMVKNLSEHGIASFVLPRSEANVVGEMGLSGTLYEPPTIKEKIPFTAETLVEQGGTGDVLRISDTETQEQAATRRIAAAALQLKNRALAREEQMAIGALSGGWTYDDGSVALTVDFDFPTDNEITLAGADLWASGTQDIVGDLESWFATVEASGGIVRDIVMGASAYAAFAKDSAIKDLYDNNNVRVGAIDESLRVQRTNKYARGTYKGANVFAVTEKVINPDGSSTQLVNPNGVWVIGDNLETDRVYARIPMIDPDTKRPITVQEPAYLKEYISGDDLQTLYVMYVSRPFSIIKNPEAVVYADVL